MSSLVVYDPVHDSAVAQLLRDLINVLPAERRPALVYTADRWAIVEKLIASGAQLAYGPSCVPLAAVGRAAPFDTRDPWLLIADREHADGHVRGMQNQAVAVLNVRHVLDLAVPAAHDWMREQLAGDHD